MRHILLLALLLQFSFAASATDNDIDSLIGQRASVALERLGEPMLKTPSSLWYSNESEVRGGQPRSPTPTLGMRQNGFVSGGVSGEYVPLELSREICDISIKLDRAGIVTEIEKVGPGCFNFVHELERRAAP